MPDATVIVPAATVMPTVHVPLLPPVVVTPSGIVSVNAAVSEIAAALELPSANVSVDAPPTAMLAGRIVLPRVGPTAVTVRGALAGPALPELVESVPVVFVTVPGVLDVIGTEIVQPPTGITLPEATVTAPAVTVTAAHVVLPEPVVVTPSGIVSVNAEDKVIGAALVLPSVSVSVDAPPTAMLAGRMVLPSEGPKSSSVSVSDALADDPAPLLARLVAVTVLVIDGAVMLAAKFTGWLYVTLLPAAAGTYAPVTPKLVPELVTMPHNAPGPTATHERPALCVTPAGNVSASVTFVASDGPPLVSTMTYVAPNPGW